MEDSYIKGWRILANHQRTASQIGYQGSECHEWDREYEYLIGTTDRRWDEEHQCYAWYWTGSPGSFLHSLDLVTLKAVSALNQEWKLLTAEMLAAQRAKQEVLVPLRELVKQAETSRTGSANLS